MKFLLLLLLFLTTRLYCFPQYNLVPNYSFEDSVICPDNINGNTIPKPWYVPSNFNTNSYVNSCSLIFAAGVPYNLIIDTSFQYAKTGNG